MANPEIKNNDYSQVEVFNPLYLQDPDAVLTFAGAATVENGTLLGLAMVVIGSVTPGSNTGDGVVSALALADGGPAKPGSYNLECVEAITNSGRFKLERPDGSLVSNNIIIPVSGNITVVLDGITFNIADGATDFIVGDDFALGVTENANKFVPFQSDAVDGSQIPKAILTYDRTATGAGDLRIRPLIGGEVLESVFVFEKVGDTIDTVPVGQTETVQELLRDVGITVREGRAVDELDNQ